MHRNQIFKVAALVVLLGFIFLSAPGLSSAEKKSTKFDFSLLLKKPAMWISSVLNMFTPIFDNGNNGTSTSTTPNKSNYKIKPTGGLPAPKPSGGD